MHRFSKLAVVLLALAPFAVNASGYANNFADWKRASPEQQALYLQGVIDGWLQTFAGGEASWVTARRKGLLKCMVDQQIDHAMLTDMVNSHYKAYKADWRVSPAVVLQEEIQAICLQDINQERATIGLAPWERKSGQISKDAP